MSDIRDTPLSAGDPLWVLSAGVHSDWQHHGAQVVIQKVEENGMLRVHIEEDGTTWHAEPQHLTTTELGPVFSRAPIQCRGSSALMGLRESAICKHCRMIWDGDHFSASGSPIMQKHSMVVS